LGENMVKLWKKWEILGWSSSIILVNIEEYWTYENIINWYHQLSDKNDWNHQAGKVWTSRAIKKSRQDGKEMANGWKYICRKANHRPNIGC
jgi:hypothetical protein